MRNPQFRARLLSEQPDDPNPSFVGIIKQRKFIYKLADPVDYHFTRENSSGAIAERLGKPEDEVIYDALLEDDGRAILGFFPADTPNYIRQSTPLVGRGNTIVSLGDGGAHYGMICDAAYTTYLLAQRLGRDGLTLPRLIKAMTSQPAASVGLLDRGVIGPGYKADLNVIDIGEVQVHRPSITADLPAGGKRLSQHGVLKSASEPADLAMLVDMDPLGGRMARQARHGHDLAAERDDETGTGR
jgi:N-acyl-D-aspartate/D-glutamate deacylase